MHVDRAYYSDSVGAFLKTPRENVIEAIIAGGMAAGPQVEADQYNEWVDQIALLKQVIALHAEPPDHESGGIFFEFSIPRLGARIDVVLVLRSVVFVLEFKREPRFTADAQRQVLDYALDLKHFHQTSHHATVAPVLVSMSAGRTEPCIAYSVKNDRLIQPVLSTPDTLSEVLRGVLEVAALDDASQATDGESWATGRYSPTPSIVEAAMALYRGHTVAEIARSDAGAEHIARTCGAINSVIAEAQSHRRKAICFITGVPGAGKTLVGLDIATRPASDEGADGNPVFLSGNGPLVEILREALARDQVARAKALGERMPKKAASRRVKAFIQNVHHFRDDCLVDPGPPHERVAIFDEAQRAWNLARTADFMARRKRRPGFAHSEPEFLISCLDRHSDWAAIVCLVGGGQEINTGEAGIAEWLESIRRAFPAWHVHVSDRLAEPEYAAAQVLEDLRVAGRATIDPNLHLGVSMRSFRAENVSLLVRQLLDLDAEAAQQTAASLAGRFPIVLTRDLGRAKEWLKFNARGSERFGIVVSSQAERLKPHAIDVRSPMEPVHYFLGPPGDVRSSYYLEDVATEFHVQGLELDWTCVTWDADLRHDGTCWGHYAFRGSRWQRILSLERQRYQKNAYRVLLTRARQGMVIVVPEGDQNDPTRHPIFYDRTFDYLRNLGFQIL